MSKRFLQIALLLCTAAVPLSSFAGEVIDRMLATVNGHIILQSDVDEAISYEAFADNRPPSSVSTQQRQAALDRLIDQELIREEIHSSDFQPASTGEVEARVSEIRKLHTEAADDVSWRAALHRYGLTPDELRERVTADLNSWKAVDARLRPSVAIDGRSIERYYQENLLPELHKKGVSEVSLAEVAPQIKEILTQRQMNDLLAMWLKSVRTESNIQIAFVPGLATGGGSH
jgi:peptidyl-prolyl cis-trans isomerase SurA